MWRVNFVLCWKTKWGWCPLGWGDGLCGCSSCVCGLRSLLNTERILTFPTFLLSDGSFMWMWNASFAQWCRMLVFSIIVQSLNSAFGWFVEMWWFLMALVVWFLWSEILFFSWTYWFHLCIQLHSCGLGISSDRLCQFSEHLELDLLDPWVKTRWCWYL